LVEAAVAEPPDAGAIDATVRRVLQAMGLRQFMQTMGAAVPHDDEVEDRALIRQIVQEMMNNKAAMATDTPAAAPEGAAMSDEQQAQRLDKVEEAIAAMAAQTALLTDVMKQQTQLLTDMAQSARGLQTDRGAEATQEAAAPAPVPAAAPPPAYQPPVRQSYTPAQTLWANKLELDAQRQYSDSELSAALKKHGVGINIA
jgi:hypothetical protein